MELRREVQVYSRELNFFWTCKGLEGCDVDAKVSVIFGGGAVDVSPDPASPKVPLKEASSTVRIFAGLPYLTDLGSN